MATKQGLSVGQVVKLKSGGPEMTIRSVIEPDPMYQRLEYSYHCQWFAGKKLESGQFPHESLILIQLGAEQ
jgi:uncharacterized protein YodC (DUF2158 family)